MSYEHPITELATLRPTTDWEHAMRLSTLGNHKPLADLIRVGDAGFPPDNVREYLAGLIESAPKPRGRPPHIAEPGRREFRSRMVREFYERQLKLYQSVNQQGAGSPSDCAERETMEQFHLSRTLVRQMTKGKGPE